VAVPDVEEEVDGPAEAVVQENARRKVAAVHAALGPAATGRVVLGVDTVVALDGRLYGKPRDAAEAESHLRALAGRTHAVWSGLALVDPEPADGADALAGRPLPADVTHGPPPRAPVALPLAGAAGPGPPDPLGPAALAGGARVRTVAEVTAVYVRPLEERDLAWYLSSGEWAERAGAYAIQGRGAALIGGIEGDYLNVVGLPVGALMRIAPELVIGSGGSG
jgi:septum formation protein